MYSFSEWIAMVNFQAKLTLTTAVDTCYIFIKVHLPHPAEDKSRNKMHPYTIFRPEQLEKMELTFTKIWMTETVLGEGQKLSLGYLSLRNLLFIQKLQQNGRMGTIMLKSNPIPTRDSWRAKTKSSSHQDPGESSSDPHKRLSETCLWKFKGLLRRCGSSVASHRDRGAYSSKLGGAACGVKSSWRRSPLALP